MEAFDPNLSPTKQYATYRADPEWQKIYRFLSQECYWHYTTRGGWEGIRESGEIRPNIDGRYPMRFEFETRRSVAFVKQCVSLFDFATPSFEEMVRAWDFAWPVLTSYEHDVILIQLDRKELSRKVIPNSAARDREWTEGRTLGRIEHVEVWYPEAISTEAITNVYRVPPSSSSFGQLEPEQLPMEPRPSSR